MMKMQMMYKLEINNTQSPCKFAQWASKQDRFSFIHLELAGFHSSDMKGCKGCRCRFFEVGQALVAEDNGDILAEIIKELDPSEVPEHIKDEIHHDH